MASFETLDPDLLRLAADIAPGSTPRDRCGWTSRNLLLELAGLVLRGILDHPEALTGW